MTEAMPRASNRIDPLGILFLMTTSIVWGLNWPVMKFALSEWPPLSARGWTGVVGARPRLHDLCRHRAPVAKA